MATFLSLLLSLGLLGAAPIARDAADCAQNVTISSAKSECRTGYQDTQNEIDRTVDLYRYALHPICKEMDQNNACMAIQAQLQCVAPPDTFQYRLERQLRAGGPAAEWEVVSTVCLGENEEIRLNGNGISGEMIASAFTQMTWPAATLAIQPINGETLVNLETIFYTDSTAPVTQVITLLEQAVTIEATPVSFTWHWATGKDDVADSELVPHTTNHGGAPFPNQTITHSYTRANSVVHPRLDVTYKGRYRVGDGEWQDIPAPLTVTGTPTNLTVLEARPTLVR